MNKTQTAIFLWLFFLVVVPVRADKLLRWKWQPGEMLKYEFTQSTKTDTAGTGKSASISIDMTMTVAWKIESVDDRQVATIQLVFERLRVTLKTDKLEPIVYDSAAKATALGPAKEIADSVSKLVGASCKLQLSDRGEILNVESSEILRQAIEKNKDSTISGLLTAEGLAGVLRQTATILPEQPVADGAKWSATQKIVASLGTLQQTNEYTFVETAGATGDKIMVTSSLTGDGASAAKSIKETQQTGTLWFDATAGRFVASEVTQKMVTERPYRELTIRVQSDSTLTMKLVK